MKHDGKDDEKQRGSTESGPTFSGHRNDEAVPVDGAVRAVWTRGDFEAALPLYVGGDLGGEDAALVERWVALHPEDESVLRAAEAARGVLIEHARRFERRATPDLWPGIRDELAGISGREAALTPEEGPSHSEGGEVLVGPRHWYQRRAVATAAALLLVGSFGGLLAAGPRIWTQGSAQPGGGAASDYERYGSLDNGVHATSGGQTTPGSQAAIAGSRGLPLIVTPASDAAADPSLRLARQGQPFLPTGGEAEHLFESAAPVPLRRALHEFRQGASGEVKLTSDR